MSEFVYPLDGTQNYTASQAGAFNGTRTSGVWAGDGNLQPTITDAREINISKGLAWFTTDDYWGKVYCNTDNVKFTLPVADGVLDRICRFVIRWDKIENVGKLMMLQGELSSTPVAPVRNATDELYDLVIADYLVQHGETVANAANLTDRRLDETVCGLMRDGVTAIPTQALYEQWLAWYQSFIENSAASYAGWETEFTTASEAEFYEWFNMLVDVSDGDSISNLANLLATHTHGNISRDGKIGTVSGKLVETGTGGEVIAGRRLQVGSVEAENMAGDLDAGDIYIYCPTMG